MDSDERRSDGAVEKEDGLEWWIVAGSLRELMVVWLCDSYERRWRCVVCGQSK